MFSSQSLRMGRCFPSLAQSMEVMKETINLLATFKKKIVCLKNTTITTIHQIKGQRTNWGKNLQPICRKRANFVTGNQIPETTKKNTTRPVGK